MGADDSQFGGRIGRTYEESEPWWPQPRDLSSSPNVVVVALDDTGFAHLGCYGSTIETPNIDRLASGGLRYTGFHTTALCSPSRACLLTGRNHHSVGMRAVSNFDTGFPNMRGGITPRAATIAELLRDAGYATYAVGKWHLAPMSESSAAGPHHNWPLQKGFDRFYGFLQGETDQFYPELTVDNHHIDPPAGPEAGYHVSEDIVDQAMGWIRDLKSVRPQRPFFLYTAFGATHSPHQAPREYLEKYRGRFDEGWDAAREAWFARQIEMGVVPKGTTLAPLNPGVSPWADLDETQQRFAARLQEAFAAFLDHTDAQIGRLVDFLAELDLLDDTLFVVLSDNGASQEGGSTGVMNEFSYFNFRQEDVEDLVANHLDDIGTERSHSNIPWGWAQVGNTPLRWYKQNTYGGGVRDPLVIHWPRGIRDGGELRQHFCHVVDVAPTILEAAGVSVPERFAGHQQLPLHGHSLFPGFGDDEHTYGSRVQYFEQFGHRGLWMDGWKAVTFHRKGTPYDDEEWSLYHLDEDFSECNDLAKAEPERLRNLVDTWWSEAGRHGVLPLDDRSIELFAAPPRPGSPHARDGYVYYPPISHLPAEASPPTGGRNWHLQIDVEVGDGPCEGVLYARGSHNGGHSFFVKGGELHFDYNALGVHYRASAPVALSSGSHQLGARFDRDGPGGTLTINADGEDLASVEIPKIVRMLSSTGTDFGRDRLSTVVDDYPGPFAFTGTLGRVEFGFRGRHDKRDIPVTARAELAKE
jgi:arylsulfatase A-like enzyme